ncbi:MAG: sugar ABC transporter permease, partial [Pseudomonadota bacterium]
MATSETAARRAGFLFTAPALLLTFLILLLPIMVATTLSFTNYSLGNSGFQWIGLDNYERIFTRRKFEKMLWATGIYVAAVVPISLALGLGAALLITSVRRFGDFYKTIYFLPVMAALLAMAIVWEFALHPTIGIVNEILESGCAIAPLRWWGWYDYGCEEGFPLWLGDKEYALGVVCFVGIWQSFGFNMVLYLAGLTSIPRELYNAAEMDGARTAWDRFRLVTWPMLGPTTVFVITITSIRSFQVFDIVEAFYPIGAGPSRSAFVAMFAIFETGVQQNLVGLGASITVVFLAFIMVLTLILQRGVERKV